MGVIHHGLLVCVRIKISGKSEGVDLLLSIYSESIHGRFVAEL